MARPRLPFIKVTLAKAVGEGTHCSDNETRRPGRLSVKDALAAGNRIPSDLNKRAIFFPILRNLGGGAVGMVGAGGTVILLAFPSLVAIWCLQSRCQHSKEEEGKESVAADVSVLFHQESKILLRNSSFRSIGKLITKKEIHQAR